MTSTRPRVVLLDRGSLAPESLHWDRWQELRIDLQVYDNTRPERVLERIQEATAVLTNKVVLTNETMSSCPKLRFISVMATGVNNIDLTAARKNNIVVSNARDYGTESVAQHTWMLILALSHRLYEYQTMLRQNAWSEQPFFALLNPTKTELTGKTLGLIGLGTLGRAVAQKASAFGMKVCALASVQDAPTPVDFEVERLQLSELLARSDVLSLHCPLTEDNAGLINKESLSLMKPGALLINTARGGLIDNQALLSALKSGHLGGAALDTLETEPPPSNHPLITSGLPNLLITPHHAWGSQRARQKLLDQTLDNLIAFLDGCPIRQVL